MKSVCFLLGAVIVALILPAQAKDRGRSLCASSGPPLPASAAELFKEAEKDYMPGIRIGHALGETVLPELRQALRSGSVARLMLALPEKPEFDHPSSIIYFKIDEIHRAHEVLDVVPRTGPL